MAIAIEELSKLQPRPWPRPLLPEPARPVTPPAPRRRPLPAAVYRRRRVAVALLAGAVLAGAWVVGAQLVTAAAPPAASISGAAAGAAAPAPPAAPVTVVIAPGDTLWALAEEHAPAGDSVMAYAAAIAEHNGVDARAIRPGDVVRLP